MKKIRESRFLLDSKESLKEIVNRLSKEFKYVSILGTDVEGTDYTYATSNVMLSPSMDMQRGFVVRVYQDTGFSEYSFNKIDVEKVCEKMISIAKEDRKLILSGLKNIEYSRLPEDEKVELFEVNSVKNLPSEDNPDLILSKLKDLHDKTKKEYSNIVQLVLRLSVTQVNKIFLSNNKDLYQSYAYSTVMALAAASNGENTKMEHMSSSGLKGSELLDEIAGFIGETCKRAEELLESEKVIPGEYDIICDPDFTGLIAHEAFGHGAEMDMYVKNRAKGAEYQDKRVASDKVIMHDGASAIEEVSSYYFDDEGNLAKDTVIIENGILKQGMCDELSAILLGKKSTGNGKRESYKRKVYTRMTNTFFEAGSDKLEDMIASIDKGYLLEGFSSGMEDPKNWGIQCVASKGREIINGKLTGKVVSPLYLTGYVPDLLESIDMVSEKVKMSGSGYCGKGWKEWVKTSTGGSYIKAKGKLS